MKSRIAIAILSVLLLCPGPATAAKKVKLKTQFLGTSQMTVSGHAEEGMWLGVSIVGPSGSKSRLDQVIPVNRSFRKRIKLERKLRGGTYELALWSKMVKAADCTNQECSYCPLYGQHLEGRAAYQAGRLKSGLVLSRPAFRLQRMGGPWNGPMLSFPLR